MGRLNRFVTHEAVVGVALIIGKDQDDIWLLCGLRAKSNKGVKSNEEPYHGSERSFGFCPKGKQAWFFLNWSARHEIIEAAIFGSGDFQKKRGTAIAVPRE